MWRQLYRDETDKVTEGKRETNTLMLRERRGRKKVMERETERETNRGRRNGLWVVNYRFVFFFYQYI